MFSRLFSSKRTGDKDLEPPARSPSPSTESASMSASAATGAPGSPTRGPMPPRSLSPILHGVADAAALKALITTCPPKTLYSYTLSRLDLATPAELHALSTFLSALEPPARLHCVRCHKEYTEVENDDRSCTMPHDDDSAEVEHVGYARGSAAGAYETRWDCCGRTVDGDGDLGPPSGWCYEGKHTMDRKRARYRNDSTPTSDLLESCESRGCHRKRNHARVPLSDDARSMRSARSESEHTHAEAAQGVPKPKKRGARKRSQKTIQEDGGQYPEEPAPKKKKRKVA